MERVDIAFSLVNFTFYKNSPVMTLEENVQCGPSSLLQPCAVLRQGVGPEPTNLSKVAAGTQNTPHSTQPFVITRLWSLVL